MDDAGNRLAERADKLELDLARIEVNAAFVHWRWCNERLRELVNSHSFHSGDAFCVLFAVLRRESRLAEVAWVSALYGFKWLKEAEGNVGSYAEDGK